MSELFDVTVSLRQGCVMSIWLFNVYMDGDIREVNVRILGRGLLLKDQGANDWRVNQLLLHCIVRRS